MITLPCFSSEPCISFAAEESNKLQQDFWRVQKSFSFNFLLDGVPAYVSVPRGYLTDGASVPRTLWSIVSPWGRYAAAVIVHDILCEYLSIVVDGKPHAISRKQADELLYLGLHVLQVSAQEASAIKLGVEAYRKVFQPKDPNWHKVKAELEAKWVARNPE